MSKPGRLAKFDGSVAFNATELVESDRKFAGWLTVAVKDRQGDIVIPEGITADEYVKVMGGPLLDMHSNKPIGRITQMELKPKNLNGKLVTGVYVEGFIFKGKPDQGLKEYPAWTSAWDEITQSFKAGKPLGLSLGGDPEGVHMRREGNEWVRVIPITYLEEVSLVRRSSRPANPESMLEDYNKLAKSEGTPLTMSRIGVLGTAWNHMLEKSAFGEDNEDGTDAGLEMNTGLAGSVVAKSDEEAPVDDAPLANESEDRIELTGPLAVTRAALVASMFDLQKADDEEEGESKPKGKKAPNPTKGKARKPADPNAPPRRRATRVRDESGNLIEQKPELPHVDPEEINRFRQFYPRAAKLYQTDEGIANVLRQHGPIPTEHHDIFKQISEAQSKLNELKAVKDEPFQGEQDTSKLVNASGKFDLADENNPDTPLGKQKAARDAHEKGRGDRKAQMAQLDQQIKSLQSKLIAPGTPESKPAEVPRGTVQKPAPSAPAAPIDPAQAAAANDTASRTVRTAAEGGADARRMMADPVAATGTQSDRDALLHKAVAEFAADPNSFFKLKDPKTDNVREFLDDKHIQFANTMATKLGGWDKLLAGKGYHGPDRMNPEMSDDPNYAAPVSGKLSDVVQRAYAQAFNQAIRGGYAGEMVAKPKGGGHSGLMGTAQSAAIGSNGSADNNLVPPNKGDQVPEMFGEGEEAHQKPAGEVSESPYAHLYTGMLEGHTGANADQAIDGHHIGKRAAQAVRIATKAAIEAHVRHKRAQDVANIPIKGHVSQVFDKDRKTIDPNDPNKAVQGAMVARHSNRGDIKRLKDITARLHGRAVGPVGPSTPGERHMPESKPRKVRPLLFTPHIKRVAVDSSVGTPMTGAHPTDKHARNEGAAAFNEAGQAQTTGISGPSARQSPDNNWNTIHRSLMRSMFPSLSGIPELTGVRMSLLKALDDTMGQPPVNAGPLGPHPEKKPLAGVFETAKKLNHGYNQIAEKAGVKDHILSAFDAHKAAGKRGGDPELWHPLIQHVSQSVKNIHPHDAHNLVHAVINHNRYNNWVEHPDNADMVHEFVRRARTAKEGRLAERKSGKFSGHVTGVQDGNADAQWNMQPMPLKDKTIGTAYRTDGAAGQFDRPTLVPGADGKVPAPVQKPPQPKNPSPVVPGPTGNAGVDALLGEDNDDEENTRQRTAEQHKQNVRGNVARYSGQRARTGE